MAMAPSSDNGAGFFSRARGALRGDVVLGNLEGTLATGGSSKCGASSDNCFAFRAPPRVRQGTQGRRVHGPEPGQQPRARLRAFRPGPDRGRARSRRPAAHGPARRERCPANRQDHGGRHRLRPLPVGQRPARHPGRRRARAEGRCEGRRRGRDHARQAPKAPTTSTSAPASETYLGENRGNEVAFGHAVVNAGADLVIGHGPHVLRAMEWYHGRVDRLQPRELPRQRHALDLGAGQCQRGAPGAACAATARGSAGRSSPCVSSRRACRSPNLAKGALSVVRTLSREDLGARAMGVSASGALRPPR